MKISQVKLSQLTWTDKKLSSLVSLSPHLITVFGSPEYFEDRTLGARLRKLFPESQIIGCSTAGEISESGFSEQSLIVSGVRFNNPNVKTFSAPLHGITDSFAAGARLGMRLVAPDLSGVFILGQGVGASGNRLVQGLRSKISQKVIVTGGLAATNEDFQKTYILANEVVAPDVLAAFGLYGKNLKLAYGAVGGWEPFAPIRTVTKAEGSTLFELDGEPALEVYKKYLGESARDLPQSALHFPFAIVRNADDRLGIVRSVIDVNEAEGSLILAADIWPQALVRLMHTQAQGLVHGAEQAARKAVQTASDSDAFAILISDVGRKKLMGAEAPNEIAAVKGILKQSSLTGFYSRGEISPQNSGGDCQLHNQTLTIARISEAS